MEPLTRKRVLLSAAFVLWAGLVLAAFYAVQKPITADDVAALTSFGARFHDPFDLAASLDAVLNLIVAIAFVLIAAGVGSLLLSPRAMPTPSAEHLLLSAGIGFGAIGLIAFACALLGFMRAEVFYAIGVSLAMISARRISNQLRALRIALRAMARLPILLRVALGVTFVMSLLIALTPPTAWDALVYHLAVPRESSITWP